jgi:hypothetical protein
MNTYIIFDNSGMTLDRFTIINKETGDVFAAGEDPGRPEQTGKWIGNCAAHHIVLNGCGWRQRLPSKKIIISDTENYINNARLDPAWIGREVDLRNLPRKIREYISHLDPAARMGPNTQGGVIFLSRNLSEERQVAPVQ